MQHLGEEVLSADGVTHVVRIGATVRRPLRPFTMTVQQYLTCIRARGFSGAPEPLGVDELGREVLSYVEGEIPVEPLPNWATGPEVVVALAQLIRELHDAAQGWEPPTDAIFGAIPGILPPEQILDFGEPYLVSHRDYCPGNVVFRGGLSVAFIDFDLARPTTRVSDIVNALYWWAPLRHPADRAPSLVDADVVARVVLFANSYGMNAAQRAHLVPVAVAQLHGMHLRARAAAQVDPVFARWWEQSVKDRMPRAEAWLAGVAELISSALRGTGSAK